jgi:membrane protease YdiL (CAAX protease family)
VGFIFLGKQAFQHDRISTQFYRWPDAAVALFLGTYFFILSTASSGGSQPLQLKTIQTGTAFYLLLDAIIIGFLMFRQVNPLQVFGIQKLEGINWMKKAAIWFLTLYPLIFLVQIFVESLMGGRAAPQPLVQFLMSNSNLSDRLLVGFLAVIVAPFTEELIFRGYLYGVIRRYTGRGTAILITSCLFAGIHQYLPAFFGLFLLALGLSLVYEATGCLLVSIFMHSLFNLIGVLAAVLWPASRF